MPPILLLYATLSLAAAPGAAALPPPQAVTQPAAGVFLVATAAMPDPRFRHSVILLLNHDQNGSLGVIVNRPTEVTLHQALPDFPASDAKLYLGGPVDLARILLLGRGQPPAGATRPITGNIYWSGDPKVLKALLKASTGPQRLRVFAGYAGWAAGQLANELSEGSWRLFKATPEAIFNSDPATLWEYFDRAPAQIMTRAQWPTRVATATADQ